MVEARDHVLMTFFSPFWFIASMRFNSFASTNGPFFSDRDMFKCRVLGAECRV
jgi:hypothetical protein